MKKIRLLSLIIALCIVASSFNGVVFAADESESTTDSFYYFNDFSKPENIESLKYSNCVTPTISTSDDGLSVLRLENTGGTNANASGFFYLAGGVKTSFISIPDSPVLVFEYRVRMDASCYTGDYFTTAFTGSAAFASIPIIAAIAAHEAAPPAAQRFTSSPFSTMAVA